ncbi:MAG: GTPase Era [Gammaproteobacteria bacterium]|nr:GTPase Era [Gammaproteobacteria bacterium]
MIDIPFRSGYVAILGRPNVGKSTLLNRLIGQKVSITSHKPQTTRHRILGIQNTEHVQALYIDTPGMHTKAKREVNRLMNRAAFSAMRDVDVIVFMIDARFWTQEDECILDKLQDVESPVILVLNKVDTIKDKKQLLPRLAELSEKRSFVDIVPLSVTKEVNVDQLEQTIFRLLPEGEAFFPKDQLTDQSDAFMITEIIREKIMRLTNKELPYDTVVQLDIKELKDDVLHIYVTIWVERLGQKVILIGEKGSKLKEIGISARRDLEKLFEKQVHLTLWVKIRPGWSDDAKALAQFGFR